MGTGKTLQALAAMACYREEWPLLIVVPASLRLVWAEAVEAWLPFLRPTDIKVSSTSLSLLCSCVRVRTQGIESSILVCIHNVAGGAGPEFGAVLGGKPRAGDHRLLRHAAEPGAVSCPYIYMYVSVLIVRTLPAHPIHGDKHLHPPTPQSHKMGKFEWKCVIFDESHKMVTGRGSKGVPNRIKTSLEVASRADRIIMLSGYVLRLFA